MKDLGKYSLRIRAIERNSPRCVGDPCSTTDPSKSPSPEGIEEEVILIDTCARFP
jgi:hypothetical protein